MEPSAAAKTGQGRKFAIATSDPYLRVLLEFVTAGWTPLALFSVPQDGLTVGSRWTIQEAQRLGMEIYLSRVDDLALEQLADQGCELLVVASYDWKILNWQRWLPYAVNFHPSLLPQYRGPYPQVNGLLQGEAQWGVTCHKISDQFDAGDVLAQRSFAIGADETLDRLNLRIRLASVALAGEVARDLDRLWSAAVPQGPGTYARKFTDADRVLDFTTTVAELDRRVRAFGPLECLADLNGIRVRVLSATFWREAHGHAAGTLVSAQDGELIVAVADGYAGIPRWLPVLTDPANNFKLP